MEVKNKGNLSLAASIHSAVVELFTFVIKVVPVACHNNCGPWALGSVMWQAVSAVLNEKSFR